MPDTTTIYVSKDAPKHGIRTFQAHIDEDGWARCLDANGVVSIYGNLFAPASFRLTLEEATADAEKRRARQAANLRAKLAAMEAIDLTKVREG